MAVQAIHNEQPTIIPQHIIPMSAGIFSRSQRTVQKLKHIKTDLLITDNHQFLYFLIYYLFYICILYNTNIMPHYNNKEMMQFATLVSVIGSHF